MPDKSVRSKLLGFGRWCHSQETLVILLLFLFLLNLKKKLSLLKKNHIFDLKGKNYKNLGQTCLIIIIILLLLINFLKNIITIEKKIIDLIWRVKLKIIIVVVILFIIVNIIYIIINKFEKKYYYY